MTVRHIWGRASRGLHRQIRWIAAGACALIAVQAVAGPAQAEEWLRADSPHLTVFSNAGRSAVNDFTQKIERYDLFLRALLGVPDGAAQDKLRVYLVANDADVRMLWRSSGSVAGFYSNSGDEPFLVSHYKRIRQALTNGETASDADDTSFHEYTHFFQQAHFPSGYPGWVIEGYAQYLQTIQFEDKAMVLGHSAPTLVARAKAGWLPWDKELRGATGTIDRDEWSAFYGQAWLLTHYMMSDPKRSAAFNRYLVAVSKGGDPVTAFTDSLGIDLSTLSRDIQTYYRKPLAVQRISWTAPAIPPATVTLLSPAASALLLLDARSRSFVRDTDKAAFVDTVREIAGRFPGDRFATLASARADAKYGDAARAEATLAPLLAADPRDGEALLLRARARLRLAKHSKDAAAAAALRQSARADLDAALAVAPDDAGVLYYEAVARETEPGYPSRRAIAYLARAMDVRPQSSEIRFALAEALMKAKRRPEALLVLQPIINDPHNPAGKARATKVLDAYQGEAGATTGAVAGAPS